MSYAEGTSGVSLQPGDELPAGAFLVDRATVVTLRTLCGCERAFVHRDRSMLSREWVVPLPSRALPRASAFPELLENEIEPLPFRRFRLVHITGSEWDPMPHYLYEETP